MESYLEESNPGLYKYIVKEYTTIRRCRRIMKYVNEIVDNGDMYKNYYGIQIHKRLTEYQGRTLEDKFRQDPNWSTIFMYNLGKELGLEKRKIYKWYWSEKKKYVRYLQWQSQLKKAKKSKSKRK